MAEWSDYRGCEAHLSKAVSSRTQSSDTQYDAELAREREQIAFLYGRLDAERAVATGELSGVLRSGSAETTEDLWQRDVAASALNARIGRLRVADSGLCFGRLDQDSGEVLYIGRIGLFDEDDDYRPLLTDWRAPVARPFYCATAANPEGSPGAAISARRVAASSISTTTSSTTVWPTATRSCWPR